MFLFQISNYDSPALDTEAAELFRQRLEERSRRTISWIWKVTDRVNAYADKKSGRETRRVRCRMYGALLLALGVFALIPGLMEPRTPSLIWAGVLAVIAGFLAFCLVREGKPALIPASCQKEASALLASRRAIDWSGITMRIRFDEDGMAAFDGGKEEAVPYEKMTGLFETEHLWLLVYEEEKGLLLQKRDLISGGVEEFSLYLHRRIAEDS